MLHPNLMLLLKFVIQNTIGAVVAPHCVFKSVLHLGQGSVRVRSTPLEMRHQHTILGDEGGSCSLHTCCLGDGLIPAPGRTCRCAANLPEEAEWEPAYCREGVVYLPEGVAYWPKGVVDLGVVDLTALRGVQP